MAANEAATGPYYSEEREARYISLPAGEDLQEGWFAGVDPASGQAKKAGTAGVQVIGRVTMPAPAGSSVTLERGCFTCEVDDTITPGPGLIGKIAYAQNQNSVTTTSSAGAIPAGIIMGTEDGKVWVDTRFVPLIAIPS